MPDPDSEDLVAAKELKQRLVFEKIIIEGEIGKMAGKRREEAARRLRDINAELPKIRNRIHQLSVRDDRERKKWMTGEDGSERRKRFTDSVRELMEYILFLEKGNAALKAAMQQEPSEADAIQF